MLRILIFQDLEKEIFLHQGQIRNYLNQLLTIFFFFDVSLIAPVKDSYDLYLVDFYTLIRIDLVYFILE